jgi:aminoglycoside phosphotransferase
MSTLPEPARALLRRCFPGEEPTDLRPTSGGYSHLSVAAAIGGRPCLIKAATLPLRRADLRREGAALDLLSGRALAAPARLAGADGDGWTVLVCGLLPGQPGQSLYAGPPGALPPAYRALGAALARLHAIVPEHRPADDLDLGARVARAAAALPALPLPADLRGPLAAALAHPRWRPHALRLTHGDAGLHNVLWDGRDVALVDWEWAGWADPLRDLAWLAWTLRFRDLPPELWAELVGAYGRPAGDPAPDGAALHALALGQIADILLRAHGGPAWEEWLRRARWTLGLDFGAAAAALGA